MTATGSREAEMYEAIGRAVAMCQLFEFLFVVCVKRVFKQRDPVDIDRVAPLDHKSFRPAVVALLNELKQITSVRDTFEERIKDFCERRHTLIHRWFLQKGWPSAQDNDGQVALIEFSTRLATDSIELATLLASYVVAWMKCFPETASLAARQEKEWALHFAAARAVMQIEQA